MQKLEKEIIVDDVTILLRLNYNSAKNYEKEHLMLYSHEIEHFTKAAYTTRMPHAQASRVCWRNAKRIPKIRQRTESEHFHACVNPRIVGQ